MGNALDEVREAMQHPEVAIRLVTVLIGPASRGAQVMIGKRKVGPLLFPSEGKGMEDLLGMLGAMADGDES